MSLRSHSAFEVMPWVVHRLDAAAQHGWCLQPEMPAPMTSTPRVSGWMVGEPMAVLDAACGVAYPIGQAISSCAITELRGRVAR